MKAIPLYKDVKQLFLKDVNHYRRQRLPHFYFTPLQQHAFQPQAAVQRFIPWQHWFRGRSAPATRKTLSWRLSSSLIIAFISLVTRLFMRCFVHLRVVNGHHLFEQVFFRPKGKGLLTIANHASMLDDPMLWAILPFPATWRHLLMRWSLGAKEIMFVGTIDSFFFKSGQVIPTIRGDGIHQQAMNEAIDILANGGWVHVFPEAKISQNPATTPLLPFKWGIGRLILESPTCPVVVPMYHYGMQDILPEDGTKRVPRLFRHLHVECGPPILDELSTFRRAISAEAKWRRAADASDPKANPALAAPRTTSPFASLFPSASGAFSSMSIQSIAAHLNVPLERLHYLIPPWLSSVITSPSPAGTKKNADAGNNQRTEINDKAKETADVDAFLAQFDVTELTDELAHKKRLCRMEEEEERMYARWQITTFLYHKMEDLRRNFDDTGLLHK